MIELTVGVLQRRPIGLTAIVLALVGLAGVALARLPVSLLPELDYPALVIWTELPGAPPEHVERWLTQTIEESLAGVQGVTGIESRSRLGGSLVQLRFSWQRDMDLAGLDVRRALDRVAGRLPGEAERPLVLHLDPTRRPFLILALSGRGDAALDMGDLKPLQEVVVRRLEQVEGLARARSTGGLQKLLQVEVDAAKLAAHGLTLDQVANALGAANLTSGGGEVRRGLYRFSLEVEGGLTGPEDVGAIEVSDGDRSPIFLRQVGRASWTVAERRGVVRLNGEEVLLLSLEARPDANTVDTAAEIRTVIADLQQEMPQLAFETIADESVFVRTAMASVGWAIAMGALLAVLVLRLFLRRWRTLIAVAVAVPLSVAVTMILFDVFGLGLDLISLSGLGLGIGMLVDNAIVVVENIWRRHENGESLALAARRGAAEVSSAVTAGTLTTLAVFLPLTQVDGLAGRLFWGQALAVCCSLLASLVVGLTVVPVIASRGGKLQESMGQARLDRFERWLGKILEYRRGVLAMAVLFGAVGFIVAWSLPRRPAPDVLESRIAVRVELPTHADFRLVANRAQALEAEISSWNEVTSVLADLGERDDAALDLDPRPRYQGDLTLTLRSEADVQSVLTRLSNIHPGPDVAMESRRATHPLGSFLAPMLSRGDLSVDLSSESWSDLQLAASDLQRGLAARPELSQVDLADPSGLAMYRLHLDREGMMRHGVSASEIAGAVKAMTSGLEATRLNLSGEDVSVRVVVGGERRLDDLLQQRVGARDGQLPLSRVVRVELVETPVVRARVDRASVLRLVADIAPGVGLQEAMSAVAAESSQLPLGVTTRVRGANEVFHDALLAAMKSLLFSFLLIYLILAVQFESLVQPLIILAIVPLAVAGVALTLWITGHPWHLTSLMGCVILMGIAVNDSIIKVDFANRARAKGAGLLEAAQQAGRERLRPVLMTTLTTCLGLLPLALGFGSGAAVHAPLATAVIGGLCMATALTLVVTPSLYCVLTPLRPPASAWSAAPGVADCAEDRP